MAVRREVVTLSQLLQRRSALATAKLPVQRVRSTFDAHQSQSQHDLSCHSQSAQSVYSLSQDEDSYMSLSQPQYSQSQQQYSQPPLPLPPQSQSHTYVTPSQEEPRGLHARCATPTVQQSKYFQMLCDPAQTPRKPTEPSESQDAKVEKLLDPIKKGIADINSALERQLDDRRRHQNGSAEVKERVEGLVTAVDKLWRQHRESESDQAEARTREATKVASALDEVQHSVRKMQDRMATFTDFIVRVAEHERATNRAVLAAMTGAHNIAAPSPQLRLRKTGKRKAAPSPGVARVPRKRSRHTLVGAATSGWDSVESSQSCSDVIWVDADSSQGDNISLPSEVGADGLRSALKKLQDARTRHPRR